LSFPFLRCNHALVAAGLLATLTACGDAPGSVATPDVAHNSHVAFAKQPAGAPSPEVQKWLAGLRATIAGFHRVEAAAEAGYTTDITGCLEEPGVGGMGYHYADTNLIDDVVEEFKPELLLYEPQKNGKLRLVAVEYIVPFTAWTTPTPPVLHGLTFHANQTFQVWALHAWVFHHNPAGMFADWNPTINCAHAP
jgi:hypothetical protein